MAHYTMAVMTLWYQMTLHKLLVTASAHTFLTMVEQNLYLCLHTTHTLAILAETGGRIRATNGNNSYGDFGSVATGVDPDETPVTAVVDNRTQYNATIGQLIHDNVNYYKLNLLTQVMTTQKQNLIYLAQGLTKY